MQIFLIFFLWDTVFADPKTEIFGYNRDKILTYVFGIFILRAIVLSARAVDVAGEISGGKITNFLLKPMSYFKYWFTRDISSKTLNLGFAALEIIVLFAVLRPPFFIQTNPFQIATFVFLLILAVVMFFSLLILTNLITFWMPESGWPAQFLFIVIFTEFFSGAIFPIDILPITIQKILYSLPFPYLLFFPLQVYLGKIVGTALIKGLLVTIIWTIVLITAMNIVWQKGIKRYAAEGR